MAGRTYNPTPLFGGAMKVLIPEEYQDISEIRPVPDNQEIYLSRNTGTNIIIDIVEYLAPGAYPSPDTNQNASSDPAETENLQATLYHMQEICSVNSDRFEIVQLPKRCVRTAIQAPAYTCQSEIFSSVMMPNPGSGAGGGAEAPVEQEVGTMCFMYLVRIKKYRTDILVYINVPKEPLERTGVPGAVALEESYGREIMEKVIESLEIVDYGLFGEPEA